jgi:Putative Actinobacterial Holin-X, holin superfamily III
MARAGARSWNPAGHAGLIDNAIGFVSALFAYVETRAALLAVESKALLLQLALVLAFGVGALVALIFGYIFVLGSVVVGIAHLTGISWTWVALCAGLLHIALAGVCVFLAKGKLRGRLYPEMRTELKRDQQWLKSLGKTEPR